MENCRNNSIDMRLNKFVLLPIFGIAWIVIDFLSYLFDDYPLYDNVFINGLWTYTILYQIIWIIFVFLV